MITSPNDKDRYDAVVIGGGCNGLTCAALLAKAGRRVALVERRNTFGGLATGDASVLQKSATGCLQPVPNSREARADPDAASGPAAPDTQWAGASKSPLEFHPDYRPAGLLHDTTRLRSGVIEALELDRHGLTFSDQPPALLAPQTDGPGLLLSSDPGRAEAEIRAHSPHDAQRYHEYRRFFDGLRPLIDRLADHAPPSPSAGGFAEALRIASTSLGLRRLGRKNMLELLRMMPMALADWLGEWFDSDLLMGALAMPALIGAFAGPRSPGTVANLLLHETLAGRAVRGGPPALVEALVRAAIAYGVELRTGTAVERVATDSTGAITVKLTGGERLSASVVAASCDPKTLFLQLLDPHSVSTRLRQRIEKLRCAGTVAMVNLALDGPLTFACRPEHTPDYARICPSLDHIERAFDAAKYGEFSRAPVLDLYVAPASPSAAAGRGPCEVSILVPFVPYSLKEGWIGRARDELGRAVIHTLARYAPKVESMIIAQDVFTPVDIERRFCVAGGHLYHADHALDQLLVRPTPECAQYQTPINGLFLCGGGCWPGGGLTCAPGANAARVILKRRRNWAAAIG